jgi:hypothetical protein
MIILLASSEDDYFVDIIEWLNHFDTNYRIINLNDLSVNNFNLHFKEKKLTISVEFQNFSFTFDDVSTFYYRSSKILIKKLKKIFETSKQKVVNSYFSLEQDSLIDFIYSEMNKKSFGYINRNPLNKILQLRIAQEVGLNIPETLICSNKTTVVDIFRSVPLINKAIQENVFVNYSEEIFIQRVEKLETITLENKFFSSLFQIPIKKKLEIRTFYLNSKLYSIGFYSLDQKVDMRDSYSSQSHYKVILPKKVEKKIVLLMSKLNLECGSIDLILSSDGLYYFLEVNTEGQYDWVSKLGGYNLDFLISNHLIDRENEFKSRFKKTN